MMNAIRLLCHSLLVFWLCLAPTILLPQASYGYDGQNQTAAANVCNGTSPLEYDAVSVLATGETKNGTNRQCVLFAKVAEFLAAEGTTLRLPATMAWIDKYVTEVRTALVREPDDGTLFLSNLNEAFTPNPIHSGVSGGTLPPKRDSAISNFI
jgi:hypothetical protein